VADDRNEEATTLQVSTRYFNKVKIQARAWGHLKSKKIKTRNRLMSQIQTDITNHDKQVTKYTLTILQNVN
jgi:hypothetical protein